MAYFIYDTQDFISELKRSVLVNCRNPGNLSQAAPPSSGAPLPCPGNDLGGGSFFFLRKWYLARFTLWFGYEYREKLKRESCPFRREVRFSGTPTRPFQWKTISPQKKHKLVLRNPGPGECPPGCSSGPWVRMWHSGSRFSKV